MTRTINTADLKGKKVFSISGEPLFEEPIAKSIPQIMFSPEITIQQPEIHIPPTVVYVDAPDLTAISETMEVMKATLDNIVGLVSKETPAPIVNVGVEAQAPIDMTPIANAIQSASESVEKTIYGISQEINNKPDHSEAIISLLSTIASRPQTTGYSFKITRDAHGDVEDVAVTYINCTKDI